MARVGFVLSIVVAPVGCLVSVVALIMSRGKPDRGKGLPVAGVIIGAILTPPFLLLMLLVGMARPWQPNPAEVAARPIAREIRSIGGKKICSQGDPGRGIDNFTPWYTVRFELIDTLNVEAQIDSIAARTGYDLGVDHDLIRALRDDDTYFPRYAFDPTSSYLLGHHGGWKLSVTIDHNRFAAGGCDTGTYRVDLIMVRHNHAVVTLAMSR